MDVILVFDVNQFRELKLQSFWKIVDKFVSFFVILRTLEANEALNFHVEVIIYLILVSEFLENVELLAILS